VELARSVWNILTGAPSACLGSTAVTHRCHLIDASDMESSHLKELPGDLVKLGEGLGVQFERFTQPSSMVDVSIEANPWQKEVEVKEALEGLSFVDMVEAVKQFWLKNGHQTGRFMA
jgi:hypothetical protein